MTDYLTIIIIGITFFLAGGIKGVVGLGLPTISLALLAIMFDLVTAIVLTLIPSLITNIWQALSGANSKVILKRILPFLIIALITIWLGAYILSSQSMTLLTLLLGILLISYSLLSLFGVNFSIANKHRKWTGIFLGTVNGLITGMAGIYIVPSVMYFQAIGLRRDEIVQAMGILFSLSSVSMLLAYQHQNMLTVEQTMLSLYALFPALIGMYYGKKIRPYLSETTFKKVLFISLLFIGCFVVIKSLFISNA